MAFTDIRNFTALSEKMSPLENFDFVRKYSATMGPSIRKNGGFINQYLGDGIMAIFQSSAADALQACIDMFTALDDFNRDQPHGERIKVGMGLHYGSLVMGIIGDDQRKDAATISDTVNTASRIESETKSFGASLLLSQSTYDQLPKDQFHCRALGNVLVHGKSKPVNIYECYNHESPEDILLKQETIDRFNEAVQKYLDQNYRVAKTLFQSVLVDNPRDDVATSFVLRCDKQLEMIAEVK